MPPPKLSHLQFMVLSILLDTERSGRDIRAQLASHQVTKTLAAFYQLMSRLEEAKLVEGWYVQDVIDGIPIKERFYKIIGNGIEAWEETRDFYLGYAGLGFQGA